MLDGSCWGEHKYVVLSMVNVELLLLVALVLLIVLDRTRVSAARTRLLDGMAIPMILYSERLPIDSKNLHEQCLDGDK